jgi:hypothetical protein
MQPTVIHSAHDYEVLLVGALEDASIILMTRRHPADLIPGLDPTCQWRRTDNQEGACVWSAEYRLQAAAALYFHVVDVHGNEVQPRASARILLSRSARAYAEKDSKRYAELEGFTLTIVIHTGKVPPCIWDENLQRGPGPRLEVWAASCVPAPQLFPPMCVVDGRSVERLLGISCVGLLKKLEASAPECIMTGAREADVIEVNLPAGPSWHFVNAKGAFAGSAQQRKLLQGYTRRHLAPLRVHEATCRAMAEYMKQESAALILSLWVHSPQFEKAQVTNDKVNVAAALLALVHLERLPCGASRVGSPLETLLQFHGAYLDGYVPCILEVAATMEESVRFSLLQAPQQAPAGDGADSSAGDDASSAAGKDADDGEDAFSGMYDDADDAEGMAADSGADSGA